MLYERRQLLGICVCSLFGVKLALQEQIMSRAAVSISCHMEKIQKFCICAYKLLSTLTSDLVE